MRRYSWLLATALFLACLVLSCKGEADKAVEKEAVAAAAPEKCEPCPPCPEAGEAAEAAQPAAPQGDGPEESVLYHLVDKYEPVVFTHESHVDYEENCEVCHHHSSEVERFPPCRACHGETFSTLDRPGLKGAYHRQCLECHKKMESGPLGCEDCHKKRAAGPVVQEDLAKKYAYEIMTLGHLEDGFEPSVFNHLQHTKTTGDCSECHHLRTPHEVAAPCRECHTRRVTAEGDKTPGLKDAYHQQCIACHKEAAKTGQKVALNCVECHKAKNLPESIKLSKIAKRYAPVIFDHETHSEIPEACTDCHHANKDFGKFVGCDKCHVPGTPPEGKTNLKTAFHKQCIGCHKESDEGPTACADCHEK